MNYFKIPTKKFGNFDYNLKYLKKVAPEMGGVSVIFEESLSVMSVSVTLDDPDTYAKHTKM